MTGNAETEKRAMVIMAHPDDAEFASAGTVAKWASDGWDVRYVVVTDGSAGGGDDAIDVSREARERLVSTRKAEQIAAGEVIGLSGVDFLDYPDGLIEPSIELRRDLVRLMRRHRPSRVICMAPEMTWNPFRIGLYHPDHLAVAQAAIAAIYPATQNPWDFPELLLEEDLAPHKVCEVWFVAAPHPNTWVDVTDVMDKKLDALRAHDSQLGENFEWVEQIVRGWMAEIGSRHGYRYAEEYHVAYNGFRLADDSNAELAAPS
jgi:LmbE family N-acetylglucosaminyl deacetylase